MRFDRWHELSRTFRFRLAVQHVLLVSVALAVTFVVSFPLVKSFAMTESRKSLSDVLQRAQELYLSENLQQGISQLPEEVLQRLDAEFPRLHIGHVEREAAPGGWVYEVVASTGSEQLEVFIEPAGRIWVAKRTLLSEVFLDMTAVLRKNTGRNLSLFIFSRDGTPLEGMSSPDFPSDWLSQEIRWHEILPDAPVFKNNGSIWVGAAQLYDDNIICVSDPFDEVVGITRLWMRFFVVLTVFFLPMAGWIGFHISQQAMAGVQRISVAANRVKAGHFSERVAAGSEGCEIEKLASDFNDMLGRIEILMQELQSITANIAHDLRTPVARIRGMVESLNWEEATPDERERMAGKVMEECDRIMPLIDSILELARADAGMLVLQEEPVDLSAEVRTAHSMFSALADDKQIEFSCAVPETLPITSDRNRMQRVISNLIDNALKFTPVGGQVSIELKHNDQQAVLTVSDNGPGIPAAEQARVFERFYRIDPSRNTPGHGLGLSLVNAFVKALEGRVNIDSDAGCTITVEIPLSK